MDGGKGEEQDAEPDRAGAKRLERRSPGRRGRDRACEGAEAERGRQEPERPRIDVERVGGEKGHERVEVEADEADAGDDGEHRANLALVPRERQPLARSGEKRGVAVVRDRVELAAAHREQGGEHGHEAEGVDDEADADPGARDEHPGDRRPDHPRCVEQAGVERNGVRKLARADHLEREHLAGGRVQDERDAAEQREEVHDRERRGTRQRHEREGGGRDHGGDLRPEHEAAGVEAIDDRPREEAEERVRREPAEQQDRRSASGERESDSTSHASATFCIHDPARETIWPAKNSR